MEAFTHVFRQRNGLRQANETRAGSSNKLTNSKSGKLNQEQRLFINQNKLNGNKNLYFAQLRPKDNEFVEFSDRYEINLKIFEIFQKNDITIKYNEIENQIKIIAFQSKKFADKLVVNRKLLRCFNLPEDVCAEGITSCVTKQSNQLKIRIPKFKQIIDGSDGESLDECTECEESSDLFNF